MVTLTSNAKAANVTDEVEAKLTLLESMEGGEQMSELICAWILDETTQELAEKAKYQVEPHPEETIQLLLTTHMM